LRYAIISDIHSNLEALTAVLTRIDEIGVDKILCLGDIIGYGPNPNECVEKVQSCCTDVILGNHDFACLDESEIRYFNRFASDAIYWTIDNLTDAVFDYVAQLPISKKLENINIVHASPENPEEWRYVLSINQATPNFSYFDTQICFIGHSHVPIIFVKRDNGYPDIIEENKVQLKDNERYLINVGSVGQPRDANPKAAWALLDTDKKEYQLIRVAYDFTITQGKMLEQKLPYFLIERLASGR